MDLSGLISMLEEFLEIILLVRKSTAKCKSPFSSPYFSAFTAPTKKYRPKKRAAEYIIT